MKTITITETTKKTSELMDDLRKSFKMFSYWDNRELDREFPIPKELTSRSFNMETESSVMKGSSWNDMENIRKSMMTLREYILFFQAYFKETGNYPDIDGWTLFKDRLSDGDVARGGWLPALREVGFYWCYPAYRDSRGGARVAISLDSSAPLVPFVSDNNITDRVERIEKWIQGVKDQLL